MRATVNVEKFSLGGWYVCNVLPTPILIEAPNRSKKALLAHSWKNSMSKRGHTMGIPRWRRKSLSWWPTRHWCVIPFTSASVISWGRIIGIPRKANLRSFHWNREYGICTFFIHSGENPHELPMKDYGTFRCLGFWLRYWWQTNERKRWERLYKWELYSLIIRFAEEKVPGIMRSAEQYEVGSRITAQNHYDTKTSMSETCSIGSNQSEQCGVRTATFCFSMWAADRTSLNS